MHTWHIHISGLVQGVGFRPHVYQLAIRMNIKGCVFNATDGVHIYLNADSETAAAFYLSLTNHPPANAIITSHLLSSAAHHFYASFSIVESKSKAAPDLYMSPDIAICKNCSNEMRDEQNQRYRYPFTTCLKCGPRYSITKSLPYDRENTTMDELRMCSRCQNEYNDVTNHRHYSQTNSCPDCTIPLLLYNKIGDVISHDANAIIKQSVESLHEGKIVAVKGMGGYLLLCDATNEHAIELLRTRKKRPAKPFAVLYPSVASARNDVFIFPTEAAALEDKTAPIVLCRKKQDPTICDELVASGLEQVGVMLPCTGLLQVISEDFGKPLIATSANLSGSPIIYKDEEAITILPAFADFVVVYKRDIVVPQDDSVIRFSDSNQRIIPRRSRGLAPNYHPLPFSSELRILAMGGELKSAFALLDEKHLFVSQFLGDHGSFDAQSAYRHTLQHMLQLLKFVPRHILIDSHPEYHVSQLGRTLASEWSIGLTAIQHHKAHFAAVLAENDLLHSSTRVLGVIWDGTGYGDDGNIWGGEFFIFEDGEITRKSHLHFYPHVLNDRMSREPRLSALALLGADSVYLNEALKNFDNAESHFLQKILATPATTKTSSMGRLLDGIASLLGIQHTNTFEGEAAMKLEAQASMSTDFSLETYTIIPVGDSINWSQMITEILRDKQEGVAVSRIAFKVFVSLAECVRNVAMQNNIRAIAFSGGVFQNAVLVDVLHRLLANDYTLHFQRQLSCNDECIAFGQLAYHHLQQETNRPQHLSSQHSKTSVACV